MGNKSEKKNICLLLDSRHVPLARAVLESSPLAENWQLLIQEGKMDTVLEHEVIQIISLSSSRPSLLGRILRQNENRLILEPLRELGDDIRQNLRMPVCFESFVYPINGEWKGRVPITSNDLSCTGTSFFSNRQFKIGEQLEIVIPITSNPLLLKCEILRLRLSNSPIQLYSAKFIDMIDDEETKVREAVFGIQLNSKFAGSRGYINTRSDSE